MVSYRCSLLFAVVKWGAIVLSVLAHGQGFFLVFDPDILSFMAVWAGSKISLDRLVY